MGGLPLHKTVGAPDEKRQAKNYSDEGQCHTKYKPLKRVPSGQQEPQADPFAVDRQQMASIQLF